MPSSTFKASGARAVASPNFRLQGADKPKDPSNLNVGNATVRQLLIQLADFSLPLSYVESTWVHNPGSDTFTVERSKVVDLYKSIVEIRNASPDGWKNAPTKAEVISLGSQTPPINFSRAESDGEYRFRFPDGHPLAAPPSQSPAEEQADAHAAGGDARDDANIGDTPDANQVLLDRIAKLESALNRVGSTVELLEREGSGAAPGAVTLANEVFSDALFDGLRQTVDRPLGVAVPDTADWSPLELHKEFANSGLSEADKKKLLRKYKMDSEFTLLPGSITEEQRKKLSASAKEKETVAFKQCNMIRDMVRPVLHALDAAESGLIRLAELKTSLGELSTEQTESWNQVSIMMQNTVISLRDHYRLASSAFSVHERERQEAVMKAIHPHFSMPPAQHKAPLLKLVPQEMLDAAEKYDQSTYFARQGHSQHQRQTIAPGISKAARRAAAAKQRFQARPGGPNPSAPTQPAGQQTAVRHPATPRKANPNKQIKRNSVGDLKGAPKGQ